MLLEPHKTMPFRWHDAFAAAAATHLGELLSNETVLEIAESPPMSNWNLRRWSKGVVRHRPDAALLVILSAARNVLDETQKKMVPTGSRGGRPSYPTGRWLLLNLAALYATLGRRPSTDKAGPFLSFANDLVSAVGLPTTWIGGQLSAAIEEWRTRTSENPPRKPRVF